MIRQSRDPRFLDDRNPHADLQGTPRAHRHGQKNKVMIFRLITRGTIEERMMEMTKKKMEELDDIILYFAIETTTNGESEAWVD
ncbi:hypothetical protein L2E82_11640 [Cichorium intybus]|uniref:Uncharacterized protein n=1 Tax=Cichorium intybus TaxID=13427 RepID=A0ACB9GEW1_CICIN|nr:hypothetical protein L2E82_11640 [Cichorium intybus]